jgi:hypothetical protein
MANRRLVIQRNTSHPIVDTPKTLFLVNLAWLLNKPITINQIPEQLAIGETPNMITETLLPDTMALEPLQSDLVLSELGEQLIIDEAPEQITMDISQ